MESLQEVWSAVLTLLKNSDDISEPAFDMWISCIEPRTLEDNAFIVFVNTPFQRNIIEQQYRERIVTALQTVLGFPVSLKILCNEPVETATDSEKAVSLSALADEEFTFDNFIIGGENRFACAAAQAVAAKPAQAYNPLFIYGGSGLGKTHLLRAIQNEILRNHPHFRIEYITGEIFTNDMIEALRYKTMPEFHLKYREADVLLVDDIQFIAYKEGIQEEFFHTFDFLYREHKQIVLTSDRTPKEIATLSDRLRSRFEQGLMADIQPPDLETRIVIIKRKAEQMDMHISNEVCEYIASQLKMNVRQLEGVVKKMRAQFLLSGEQPTLSAAQKTIRSIKSDEQATPITVDKVLEEVARTMNITVDEIRSPRSTAPISKARQTAVKVIREVTDLSHEAIGKELGGRDHSTIVYSLSKADERIKKDASYKGMIDDIVKNLRSRGG